MNELSPIEDKILEYLRTHCGADATMDAETDVLDAGLLDSMLVMDLVLFVETQFAVKLDPCDITPRNFRSVGCLAQCVRGIWQRSSTRVESPSADYAGQSPLGKKVLIGNPLSALQGSGP